LYINKAVTVLEKTLNKLNSLGCNIKNELLSNPYDIILCYYLIYIYTCYSYDFNGNQLIITNKEIREFINRCNSRLRNQITHFDNFISVKLNTIKCGSYSEESIEIREEYFKSLYDIVFNEFVSINVINEYCNYNATNYCGIDSSIKFLCKVLVDTTNCL